MKIVKHLLFTAALLCAGIAAASKPQPAVCNTPEGVVKLMSFNIRQSGLAKKDGPDRWPKRRAAVAAMLADECPTVLGIQEGLIDQVRFLEKNLPLYTRIGVGRDDGADGGEMMAVFFLTDRYEELGSGTFWLSETPQTVSRGWDAACNRTVTWVHLRERATGKSFFYLNTHFDHEGAEARRRSSELIVSWIEGNVPAGATVVVGGDLNSDIGDEALRPFRESLETAREISDPTDRGGTFNSFGAAPGNIVLDHFFCRNTTGDRSLRVVRKNYGAPSYVSDHFPMVFTFELP